VAVRWLTEQLAHLLVLVASQGFGVAARLDGLVIEVSAGRQAVTPNCLGLLAITVYLAALLAIPCEWACRWRGVRRDVPLLLLANGLRLMVLVTVGAVRPLAVPVAHVIILVAVAPLVVVGVCGLWLTRDVNALPRYPWRFAGLVALAFLPALGIWWLLLIPYASVLTAVTKELLAGLLGAPIESARLVKEGLRQFIDLTLPEGGLRLEVAARSLSLVPYLALVAASPIPWVRRSWLGACGAVILFVLHAAEATGLIVMGRSIPSLIPPAEAVSDFLTLVTGPLMWILLAAPSQVWWAPIKRGRTRPAP
jgi:exosortase/archaeosortase family protein